MVVAAVEVRREGAPEGSVADLDLAGAVRSDGDEAQLSEFYRGLIALRRDKFANPDSPYRFLTETAPAAENDTETETVVPQETETPDDPEAPAERSGAGGARQKNHLNHPYKLWYKYTKGMYIYAK